MPRHFLHGGSCCRRLGGFPLLSLLFLFLALSFSPVMASETEVRIGVLAKRGPETTLKKWSATADYLSERITGSRFTIVPLSFEAIIPTVAREEVDFVLANPSFYVELEMRFGVSRIATLKNNINGIPVTSFGGVIFTRADNQTINRLYDLKGKRFAAVQETSLGGFQMAWRELKSLGVERDDFSQLRFAGTHDSVVEAVLNGEVDAGTVRTDTLERMAQEGKIGLSEVKVLNARAYVDYPFAISTRRYPEWPFAKLQFTSNALSDQVASALLSMPPDSPAAIAGKNLGWTVPHNYQSVHQILQELKIGPYAYLRDIRLEDIVRQYWRWIAGFIALLVILAFTTLNVSRLNKRLRYSQAKLQEMRDYLEDRVVERTHELNEALRQISRQEQEQSTILNTAAEGIYGIDLQGRTTFVNEAAQTLLGFNSTELIGEINHHLIHHSHEDGSPYPDVECRMYDAIRSGEAQFVTDEVLWRKDGTCFPVEYASTPIIEDGHIKGAVITFRDISERRAAEEKLTKRTAEFEAIFNSNSDAIVFTNTEREILRINPAAEQLFGYSFEEMAGNTSQMLYADDSDYAEQGRQRYNVSDNTEQPIYEMHYRRKDGSQFIGETLGTRVSDGEGHVIGFLGIIRDISERKRQEHELKQAEEQLRLAAIAMETSEAIVITGSDERILQVNHAFSRITGYEPGEVLGRTPQILNSGRHDKAFFRQMWQTIGEQGFWEGEIWNRRKNGEIYPEWLTITAVKNSAGAIMHYVGSFLDITERKASEARIKYQAYYDALTDLPNRRLLMDRLEQAIVRSRRHGHIGALLFLDLDHFKTINDSLGHPVGDALLQEIASRLTQTIRQEDTAARLGGDEFVLLLPEVSDDEDTALSHTQEVAEKVIDAIGRLIKVKQHQLHITTSIGIILFPLQSDDPDDVLKYADVAMYQAKERGKNTYQFYLPTMQQAATERLVLEHELRGAIENESLELHYQPQYDNRHNIVGAEALLRWNSSHQGWVPPDEFIPVAEETGLIIPLGAWVMRTACTMLAQLDGTANDAMRIAVNVSPRQFRLVDFVETVKTILDETGANPHRLELELTEGMLLGDIEDTISKMGALQQLGVRFAVDDFGTGYSSLSYLKRLPLDVLKVDQSFVSDIESDANDAAIVETIISMARHLGLEVVAEGVETEQQLHFLKQQGCHIFQGYRFSKPLPGSALLDELTQAALVR